MKREKLEMTDVMLDLETWGTRPGCAIRSIGAVVFDPKSEKIGNEFYVNVDEKSCKRLKLALEPGTVAWWEDQSDEARAAFTQTPKLDVAEALSQFDRWFQVNRGIRVWCQGPNFDDVILSAIYFALQANPPWRFYNARCTRTVYDLASFDARSQKREGTYHNALDDAKHQARCVQAAVARLHGRLT